MMGKAAVSGTDDIFEAIADEGNFGFDSAKCERAGLTIDLFGGDPFLFAIIKDVGDILNARFIGLSKKGWKFGVPALFQNEPSEPRHAH